MKIIDYKILKARDVAELEMQVKRQMELGWQPLNAPIFVPSFPEGFHQTLVKYEAEERPRSYY